MKNLNEKHYRCIEMLCQPDANITEIARDLGVSRTTIYDWMKDPIFKAELDKNEQEIKNRIHHTFVLRLPAAIDKLWELTNSKDARTKLQAINSWIERALGKVGTSVTLEDKRENTVEFNLDEAIKEINEEIKKAESQSK